MAETKEAFLRKRKRAGRSDAQSEADWKGARRFKSLARKKGNPKAKAKAKPKARASPKPKAKAKATTKKARKNPGMSVLVMNPAPKRRKTVAKKKAAKKRRRRRRRKNPYTSNLGGTAVAGVGGFVPAAGTFLLDGTEMSLGMQYGIVGVSSILGGALLSMVMPNLAKGMVGGGIAITSLGLARQYIAPPFGEKQVKSEKNGEELAAVRQRRRMMADYGDRVKKVATFSAVQAQLGSSCPMASEYGSCESCAQQHGGCPDCARASEYGSCRSCAQRHGGSCPGKVSKQAASQRIEGYSAVRASLGRGSSRRDERSYNVGAVRARMRGLV